LVYKSISKLVLDHIIALTIDVVDSGLTNPPPKRDVSTSCTPLDANFRQFVKMVIYRAQVEVPMVLTTAVYINRAKSVLCIARPEWAYERVFLGALIVASKYHNDSSLKNSDWSAVSGIFSPRDVSRVEREMLDVLAYELRVGEAEILDHGLLLLQPPSRPRRTWLNRDDNILSNSDDGVSSSNDSDSDSDTSLSISSEESVFPATSEPPSRPLRVISKRTTYPGFPIPGALRMSLSC